VIGWRRKGGRWSSIFADDLVSGCRELFRVYGAAGELSLPISIPIDENGVVLLRPVGPVDAPRVRATLHLATEPGDTFGLRIERRDGGRMVIPGLFDADGPAQLATLAVDVTPRGLDIAGEDANGAPVTLRFDEPAARALATALFITIRMKLAKAPRP